MPKPFSFKPRLFPGNIGSLFRGKSEGTVCNTILSLPKEFSSFPCQQHNFERHENVQIEIPLHLRPNKFRANKNGRRSCNGHD
jgi:hypothetical protein